MSLEGVTDATARVLADVPGLKGVYSAKLQLGAGYEAIKPIPADIPDTPIALVWYDRFELVPGSFERIRHFISAELWFRARTDAEAERAMLPIISGSIAAFRTKAGLFGQGTIATIERGGPGRAEVVSQQPFAVFPLVIRVLEAAVHAYESGPAS